MVRELETVQGIRDRAVLDAMLAVPRHLFVPAHLETQAYGDFALPIGSEITDLELGDVDGDGALDVIAAGDAPGLTVIHGHGLGGR